MHAVIALLLGLVGAGGAPQNGYVAIVNEANSVTRIDAAELSKMFLGKTPRWPSGLAVVPVDLAQAAAREAFTQAVHHKSVAAVRAYWQQQIFSGRGVPPVEKTSSDEVLNFVRATPGAVGYVAAGTPLGAGVKAIQVVD